MFSVLNGKASKPCFRRGLTNLYRRTGVSTPALERACLERIENAFIVWAE